MATWSDVQAAATALAGNHRKFESFAWHDRPDDSDRWTVVYTHNRDSGLLEESNAAAIAEELASFMEGEDPDVVAERHSHWAVGWVDGFAIRVYGLDGRITEAFRLWCDIQERLEDYPLLDEEDHSRREYEAAIAAIQQEGRGLVREGAPDDWASQVFSWLWDNNQRELENRDGTGAYPSGESVREALMDLEFLDANYAVAIGDWTILETASKSKAEAEFDTLAYHASLGIGLAAGQSLTLCCDDEILNEYPEN